MAGHRGRQPNVEDGRPEVFKVKMTANEGRLIRDEAASLGITPSRLLVEKGLGRGESPAARRMIYAELVALRRDVRGFVTNANQLAHWANTEGRFPREAERLTEWWGRFEARIAGMLTELRP